jgi:hypothetical protein
VHPMGGESNVDGAVDRSGITLQGTGESGNNEVDRSGEDNRTRRPNMEPEPIERAMCNIKYVYQVVSIPNAPVLQCDRLPNDGDFRWALQPLRGRIECW